MSIFSKSSDRVFPENYGTQEGEGERESVVGGKRSNNEHLTSGTHGSGFSSIRIRIYECRCDERLRSKVEGSTVYTWGQRRKKSLDWVFGEEIYEFKKIVSHPVHVGTPSGSHNFNLSIYYNR